MKNKKHLILILALGMFSFAAHAMFGDDDRQKTPSGKTLKYKREDKTTTDGSKTEKTRTDTYEKTIEPASVVPGLLSIIISKLSW